MEIVTKARDTVAKLKNPKTRYQVVSRMDTEEINRLKARYLYIKRKEHLMEIIDKYKPEVDPKSAWCTSPTSTFSQSIDHYEKDAKERKPVLDDAGCEIYMGNYNKKIPPSINYWYLNDGKNMSQKILYYRSLHPEETVDEQQEELEKSPVVDLEKNDAEEKKYIIDENKNESKAKEEEIEKEKLEDEKINKIEKGDEKMNEEEEDEKNQKKEANEEKKENEKEENAKKEEEENKEEEEPEEIEDTENNDKNSEEIKDERKKYEKETNESKEQSTENKNASNESKKESPENKDEQKENKKREKAERKKAEKNEIIKKLDKKIEKDLKKLQGGVLDDDDDGLDDEALNEVLHGSINKEIENFLKVV